MKKLTKKQKAILDNYKNISNCQNLPNEAFYKIISINDFETIHNAMNDYLFNNYFNK